MFKEILIGRDLNCDIVVEQAYSWVSGRHAIIYLDGNGDIIFKDTSTNGSTINGMPLNKNAVKVAFGTPIFLGGNYPLPWNKVQQLLYGGSQPTRMAPTCMPSGYGYQQQPMNDVSQMAYTNPVSEQSQGYQHSSMSNVSIGEGDPLKRVDESFLSSWNWGAFFLTPVWGFGNGCWWAFLIAGFFPISQILMGIFGTRLAWRNKKWDNFYQFKISQQTWSSAGVISFVLSLSVILICFIISIIGIGLVGHII